jgi:hypothetical protein
MAVLCISHTYKDSTSNSFTCMAIYLKFQPPWTNNFHAHVEHPTTPEHSLMRSDIGKHGWESGLYQANGTNALHEELNKFLCICKRKQLFYVKVFLLEKL